MEPTSPAPGAGTAARSTSAPPRSEFGKAPAEACIVVTSSKRLPCDVCGHPMEPEHAHYRCPACHYILPCCGW